MIPCSRARAAALVGGVSLLVVVAACGGGGDDEPQPGQIGRIDGPATVDEDNAVVEEEGAPRSDSAVGSAITNGS